MAGDAEESSRTEAPTERRLQQAFDEGDIALSHELVTTGAFALGLLALVALGGSLQGRLVQLLAETLTLAPTTPFGTLPSLLRPLVLPVAGVLGAMALGALALTFAQTRAHLWSDKVVPDLSKVFNPQRLTRLVSKDFLIDLGVGTVKVVAIGVASWGVVRGEFLTLGRMGHSAPADQLAQLFGGLSKIAVRTLGLLIVFAGADFALTRWRYRKRHMMTKDEVKREVKDDEGDPLLKGARKRRHRELVRRNALHETRRADALVVNPTHIAIALRYRKDEGAAPRVLAKGKGVLAEAMRDAARSSGVPIIQDIPLARLLYRKVKVGGPVPQETYKAVAAVLAVVFRMTRRGPAADEARP